MRRRPKLPSLGWGPFRRDWYSICSMHSVYDLECNLCQKGHWHNAWRVFAGHIVYKAVPDLWRWWANRGRPRMRV